METKKTKSSSSEICLDSLTLKELIALRDRIDGAIAEITSMPLNDDDAVLEYCVILKTQDSIISKNRGLMQLNKLMHPRLITTAPGRVEQVCKQHIMAPMAADLFDKLDSVSPQPDRSLHALQQHKYRETDTMPGMDLPALEF